MTQEQKQQILKFRSNGVGYKKTARALDISENTVKSFCRRNNAPTPTQKKIESSCKNCKQCGKPLDIKKTGTRPKFCSEECRRLWWKNNKEQGNKTAFYKLRCVNCGTEFESYGNDRRRYCGHACYIEHRFKGGNANV